MLKIKKKRIVLVAIVMFSMVAMYAFVPKVDASITDAKDTISNSDTDAPTVTHILNYVTGTALTQGQYIQYYFPTDFTTISVGNVSCPANTTASSSNNYVECVVDNGQTLVAGSASSTVTNVHNPAAAGDYTINIVTRAVGGAEIEATDVMVYIIDNVQVSATVPANLTFGIAGITSAQDVNGDTTTIDTSASATQIPFGTLDTGIAGREVAAQRLTVSTNADDGFSVTVQQSDELTNESGSNINSFNNSPDNTGSTTPDVWASPSAKLDETNTYGHMGFTTSDSTLTGGLDPFGTALYAGLNGTAGREVMYHNGPANGTVDGIGLADVGYKIEISGLQEAGDYTTTLTYICTPQY